MKEIKGLHNTEEYICTIESLDSDNIVKEHESVLARIVSIILHPFLMGVYGVAILFFFTDFGFIFSGQFMRFITPVFFLTCVVPASGIYFLKKTRIIKDYSLSNKKDRVIPFLLVFFSYSLLVYYFYSAQLFVWFLATLASPLLLVIIMAIINQFWKISAHMTGIGGLIGSTLSICYYVKGINPFILFIILFILAGCLGVSRLMLKRHTPAQVYAGFLVGLIVSYLCVWFGSYWGLILLFRQL